MDLLSIWRSLFVFGPLMLSKRALRFTTLALMLMLFLVAISSIGIDAAVSRILGWSLITFAGCIMIYRRRKRIRETNQMKASAGYLPRIQLEQRLDTLVGKERYLTVEDSDGTSELYVSRLPASIGTTTYCLQFTFESFSHVNADLRNVYWRLTETYFLHSSQALIDLKVESAWQVSGYKACANERSWWHYRRDAAELVNVFNDAHYALSHWQPVSA